jgi:hypothetical protein
VRRFSETAGVDEFSFQSLLQGADLVEVNDASAFGLFVRCAPP